MWTTAASVAVAIIAVCGAAYAVIRFVMNFGVWLRTIEMNTTATRELTGTIDEVTAVLRELDERVLRLEERIR